MDFSAEGILARMKAALKRGYQDERQLLNG